MKLSTFCICLILAATTRGEDTTKTLLSIDFETGNPLTGWQDFRQNSPPKSRFGALTFETFHENDTENTNVYYSALDPSFGVTIPLQETYEIGADTVRVTIRAKVRCNGTASTAGLDLSSRLYPDYPFQYSRSLASGFGGRGYQHRNEHNLLYIYHQAEAPVFSPSPAPFAPLEAGQHRWHEWQLVYEHTIHCLIFLLNGEEIHRMDNVDLNGISLNTLWLMGAKIGSDYDDIVVEAVEAQKN